MHIIQESFTKENTLLRGTRGIIVYDADIATGFNRGLEWYYLNPFSSLFIERKHQMHWREGSDTTTVIGQGDNDNHFIGGSWKLDINRWHLSLNQIKYLKMFYCF